ncbi:hypothetical protein OS493_033650 [Desmophyllum pertusum]|uniref:Uncharacterized protein n=1 Tax=Desmophyllum pertusum TaxID=174260 RepID=A0A9W9Y836_9CNID|nr:hypothetical protein OS493_033650 [Desmophyllum pertusum]
MISGKGKNITLEKQTSESTYNWMGSTFSAGAFKSLSTNRGTNTRKTEKPAATEVQGDQESPCEANNSSFSLPLKTGGVRVFQRLSALEKHLSLEKCHQVFGEAVFDGPC